MAFVLIPFIHPMFGLAMPTSATFKFVTLPVTLTCMCVYQPHMKELVNAFLGIGLPDKFSWKDKEHRRLFFVVYGIANLLVQLLIAPVLTPSPLPMPQFGKITFLTPLTVPKAAFTIATLLLIPRVASKHIDSILNIKDPSVAKLSSEMLLLGTFACAVMMRDAATPLDLLVPAVLTYLSFKLPAFDKLSKFLFQADFPIFKIFNRDFAMLGLVMYSTWLAMTLAYGDYMPVFKQVNDTVRKVVNGSPDLRFINKSIEFALLYIIPTVVRRYSLAKDRDLSFSAGFLVALLAKHMLPIMRMRI